MTPPAPTDPPPAEQAPPATTANRSAFSLEEKPQPSMGEVLEMFGAKRALQQNQLKRLAVIATELQRINLEHARFTKEFQDIIQKFDA